MLRQDHGAEQVKRDRSRTKGKALKCTVNFGEGVVECGGPRDWANKANLNARAQAKWGDSRELGMGNPCNPALVPNSASTSGTPAMGDSRLAFGG